VSLATARNVAIVLALAAAVAFVPGGGTTGGILSQILSIVFLAGLAFLGYRLYCEHRVTLYGLGDRTRAILYVSAALAVLALVGAGKLWDTGGGTLAWFALVGGAAFGLYHVVRSARTY
jgi:hypothetical protein